jgi:hypothetical protein
MPILNLLQNTVSTIEGDQFNYPIEPYFPFRATGGFMETFTTGGVEYTMHSYTEPGTGSFEILQGSAFIGLLLVGGGGCGNGPQLAGGTLFRGGAGGGGGGTAQYMVDGYNKLYVRKDPNAGVESLFEVHVGSGGRAETFGFDISLANSTGSGLSKKYDEVGYYCPNYQLYVAGGGNAYGGSGSSGAGGGGIPDGGEGPLSGGGGTGGAGKSIGSFPPGYTITGLGGNGGDFKYYWGGTSGSYPVKLAGGGPGGGSSDPGDIYNVGNVSPATGSFGAGNSGAYPAVTYPLFLPVTSSAQLTGSNGAANTGGGGAGGAFWDNGPSFGPGGNGGSGVVRIIYETQSE